MGRIRYVEVDLDQVDPAVLKGAIILILRLADSKILLLRFSVRERGHLSRRLPFAFLSLGPGG
jgi:hypothetical protein